MVDDGRHDGHPLTDLTFLFQSILAFWHGCITVSLMINVFVYTCLSAWRFEACREKDLASARCYFDQVPLERVGLGGFVVVDPEILTVVLAAFGKYNMPTCTVNLTCEASKHLSERFYWLKNIELRNRISRRTAHSGFCFLLFGEQAWKTKDSSPSYRDQTFSLWVYLYFTVVPRVPRCPFLAALTSPTGLARGQSTQWHSATEGHFRWFVAVERVHWIYWIS